MFLNYKEIPGYPKLFIDYVYDFDKVNSFYNKNFRNEDEYLQHIKNVTESYKSRDFSLLDILTNQYKDFDYSEKTKNNIALFDKEKTLAVVTGQQLGVLGGPLYTIYKTITAIKLCNHLSQRFSDYNFVPVFWLEGDDHDFNEINSVGTINLQNEYCTVDYSKKISNDDERISVGKINITDEINDFFEKFIGTLRHTEFTDNLLNKIKKYYSSGSSLKLAFKKIILSLFDEYGLIIFDPQDQNVKNELKPIFKKDISDFRTNTEEIIKVSAEIEEEYNTQIKVKPVNLFYSKNNGRSLIKPTEDGFKLKGEKENYSADDILDLIETEPQNFSPNVLLRPICQDYIFPTAFYIGGPSEVAYFAQILPLYDIYNIEKPIIFPRSSATIIEKGIKSSLEKLELKFEDLFTDKEKLEEKIISEISDEGLDEMFNKSKEDIEFSFDKLKDKLFQLDKTLADVCSKSQQKVLHYIDELKNKADNSVRRKHETTVKQIGKVFSSLFPNGSLQERKLNFIYFQNKYENDLLNKIYEELDIRKFEHQIIEM